MKQLFAAHFRNLFAGGVLLGFLSGCSVFDPAEEIPSYLHIDAITLNATGLQGTSRADISDAWVFMDGTLIGGFQIPCNIPILAEGSHHFLIKGGVKMNGLSSTRAIYTSWKGWEGEISLIRGQKVTVNPVITYFPGIDFANTWMLDFELTGTNLVPEASSSAVIVKDTIPWAYEGNYSGYIHLNNTDTTFIVAASSVGYSIPTATDSWVEFDYRCSGAFTVGIEEESNPAHKVAWLSVNPSPGWQKIYVRLTDALASTTPQNVPYKIYFAMQNPVGQSDSYLYLDNIKLLK